MQDEIHFQEDIVHGSMQMMEVDCMHYMYLCATLHRENELKDTVAHLTVFDEECKNMYNDVEKTLNRWIEDEDLKIALQYVKEVQVQLEIL